MARHFSSVLQPVPVQESPQFTAADSPRPLDLGSLFPEGREAGQDMPLGSDKAPPLSFRKEVGQAEEIKEKVLLRIGDCLEGRSNVVMTRLNDEDLTQIDALVEVEVFRSRSEAAAFFIKEGIQARKDLFQKVMPTVDRIRELKAQAKKSLGQGETQ